MIKADIRVKCATEGESEIVRKYLEKRLPGLSLGSARHGNNPKYADRTDVLAYGDINVPERGETTKDIQRIRRTRKATATKPAHEEMVLKALADSQEPLNARSVAAHAQVTLKDGKAALASLVASRKVAELKDSKPFRYRVR